MKVISQLCIKNHTVRDTDGAIWKAKQGQQYTTSIPEETSGSVMVFSSYWVRVPRENFVPVEEK